MAASTTIIPAGARCRLHATTTYQQLFFSCNRTFCTSSTQSIAEETSSDALWRTRPPSQQSRNDHGVPLTNIDKILSDNAELAAKIKQFRNRNLRSNPCARYLAPNNFNLRQKQTRFKDGGSNLLPSEVPSKSEMYTAFMTMPLSRQNVRFNPWSLFLELFDDPRIMLNTDNDFVSRGRALLAALVYLGQVTPANVLSQRPLFKHYALKSKIVVPFRQYGNENHRDAMDRNVSLTPSQLAALGQLQFPRFIANKYARQVSVTGQQVTDDLSEARRAQWDRSWLSANLAVLELQKKFTDQRIMYGVRISSARQSQSLIGSALEHAPGLVLNTIMSWNDDYNKIMTLNTINSLCAEYFDAPETIREAIVQAWQMYDWLVYHDCSGHMYGNNPSSNDTRATAVRLYQSLERFDNWKEVNTCFDRIQKSLPDPADAEMQRLSTSDHKLLSRYTNLTPQLRGYWRPKSTLNER
ncbi:hypothetical protein LPJ72_003865 [Coemansia sp. Benny D160-2]|nr:hypothetical protein LPJ72_003865 [Coemansia sp. Benny D160-2]